MGIAFELSYANTIEVTPTLLEKTTVSDWSIICLTRTVLWGVRFLGYGHRTVNMGSIGRTPYLTDRTLRGTVGPGKCLTGSFGTAGTVFLTVYAICTLAKSVGRRRRALGPSSHNNARSTCFCLVFGSFSGANIMSQCTQNSVLGRSLKRK